MLPLGTGCPSSLHSLVSDLLYLSCRSVTLFSITGLLNKNIAKIVYHLILAYTKPMKSGAWWGLKWYLRASHSRGGELWLWPRKFCPLLLPLHNYMWQMHAHPLAQELAHRLRCGHWKQCFCVLLLLPSMQREPRQKWLVLCSQYLVVQHLKAHLSSQEKECWPNCLTCLTAWGSPTWSFV